jgi:hypothetical protein
MTVNRKIMKQTLLILNDNKISENFWYQFVDAAEVKIVLIKNLDDLLSETNLPEPGVIVIDDYFRKKGGLDWIVDQLEGLKIRYGNARYFCLSPLFGDRKGASQNPIMNCECYPFSDEFTRSLRYALQNENCL